MHHRVQGRPLLIHRVWHLKIARSGSAHECKWHHVRNYRINNIINVSFTGSAFVFAYLNHTMYTYRDMTYRTLLRHAIGLMPISRTIIIIQTSRRLRSASASNYRTGWLTFLSLQRIVEHLGCCGEGDGESGWRRNVPVLHGNNHKSRLDMTSWMNARPVRYICMRFALDALFQHRCHFVN